MDPLKIVVRKCGSKFLLDLFAMKSRADEKVYVSHSNEVSRVTDEKAGVPGCIDRTRIGSFLGM
jgi:hypothetical protein